jgi:hypothetical protein
VFFYAPKPKRWWIFSINSSSLCKIPWRCVKNNYAPVLQPYHGTVAFYSVRTSRVTGLQKYENFRTCHGSLGSSTKTVRMSRSRWKSPQKSKFRLTRLRAPWYSHELFLLTALGIGALWGVQSKYNFSGLDNSNLFLQCIDSGTCYLEFSWCFPTKVCMKILGLSRSPEAKYENWLSYFWVTGHRPVRTE